VNDQRRSKRFDLKLPVEVVRKNFMPVNSLGETMNMSAGGVLFVAPLNASVGDPIEYIITFPTGSINGRGVNLRCLGKIVRVQPTKGDKSVQLVAATLERYEFVREKS
jgi:hypothetical protein